MNHRDRNPAHGRRPAAFTLVELLVVIGIIALLISILLPSLNRARASAQSTACLSNLRVIGQALQMYIQDTKGYLPYPTTTLGEQTTWSTAIDKYLYSQADSRRTGVAKGRGYARIKQCPVWDEFDDKAPSGSQGSLKEFAKTYKMNGFLRHRLPTNTGPLKKNTTCAKITECKGAQDWVFMGDGMSLDQFGPVPSQAESGRFSMQVSQTDTGDAWPAPRHLGGVNICFLDGHAANIQLRPSTIDHAPFHNSASVPLPDRWVKVCWPSEWVDASGNEKFPIPDSDLLPMCQQGPEAVGYHHNPAMTVKWSDPGRWISR